MTYITGNTLKGGKMWDTQINIGVDDICIFKSILLIDSFINQYTSYIYIYMDMYLLVFIYKTLFLYPQQLCFNYLQPTTTPTQVTHVSCSKTKPFIEVQAAACSTVGRLWHPHPPFATWSLHPSSACPSHSWLQKAEPALVPTASR